MQSVFDLREYIEIKPDEEAAIQVVKSNKYPKSRQDDPLSWINMIDGVIKSVDFKLE